MNSSDLSLIPITLDNWKECILLKVSPEQKNLVGSNVRSLAEASVRQGATTLGIYKDSTMVGFIMYFLNENDRYYYIHRFMIDEKYQKQGIGYESLKLTLEKITKLDDCKIQIMIMFLTYNHEAERLYRKIGFKDTGKIIEDEKLFYYPLLNS